MYNTKSHVQNFGIEDAYRVFLLFWSWGFFFCFIIYLVFAAKTFAD